MEPDGDDRRRTGIASGLPRTTEALVRGRVKFRVGFVLEAWSMVVPKRLAEGYARRT